MWHRHFWQHYFYLHKELTIFTVLLFCAVTLLSAIQCEGHSMGLIIIMFITQWHLQRVDFKYWFFNASWKIYFCHKNYSWWFLAGVGPCWVVSKQSTDFQTLKNLSSFLFKMYQLLILITLQNQHVLII